MYEKSMYDSRDALTRYPAQEIISKYLEEFGKVNSAIDVGCGVGTFLSVLKDKGCENIKGIDGPWVEADLLEIDSEYFEVVDLAGKLVAVEKFDLAICLEVAEHVPENNANELVAFLCNSGKFVLFSAAIPGQGGENHINEQWQEYWRQKFRDNGYEARDLIREKIWGDPKIPYWYSQNLLVYSNESNFGKHQMAPQFINLVHPKNYEIKLEQIKHLDSIKTMIMKRILAIPVKINLATHKLFRISSK
jgi:SAM-dependent methyltransferase